MKLLITISLITIFCLESTAQFYYKDLVASRQTMLQLQNFKKQKIRTVKLASFENDQLVEGFIGEQQIENNFTRVVTYTKSSFSDESQLTSTYSQDGKLIQVIDTTDGFKSITNYEYDDQNRIESITSSSSSAGQSREKEQHIWFYNDEGKPVKMLKIKNESDTTFVTFVLDEKGNVAEERTRRKDIPYATYYYYYDEDEYLTDIVRYNSKAKRLLPDYMFTYHDNGLLASMVVVPEGTDDYLKWYYTYNEKGLKTQEACFNKLRQQLGKIEYQYQF